MDLRIATNHKKISAEIKVTGSKSESNRVLLLQALYPNITIENLSNADDTQLMQQALQSKAAVIDIHHAGTAMRFLASYFAIQEGSQIQLTGSKRMKERPIEILIDALRQLGADIDYEENEGYPPLRIKGKNITKNEVILKANVSSQYISSLLLIAPKLQNGLQLTLKGTITSLPYLKMTLSLLNELGIKTHFKANKIKVFPKNDIADVQITVESDWSSASYFYSIVALSDEGTEIGLSSYKQNSIQGDGVLATLYENFGVKTTFYENQIILTKEAKPIIKNFHTNLVNAPDIAQTIAVTCYGLGIGCHLTGLHTLKIKETDRLEALYTELMKLGANINVTDEALTLVPSENIKSEAAIDTYNDHRMAMAFAPLAIRVPIIIKNAEVVSKSYPDFWKDMEKLQFNIEHLKRA
ncbi:3-phosphoshikimate 1-carboxyvinyltransferase [Leptobacterium sp. I13]|uniref:3-phosphoshikimate 1-carboxyvinyltransferase n=1 Tax=Leptobacterium meishanense TaxID=3128904 RepID=UPI0030EDFE9D